MDFNIILQRLTLTSLFLPVIAACQAGSQLPERVAEIQRPLFESETDAITFESAPRRKWDQPSIADLDQNGFPDLVINDHGYGLKVYWNADGVFAPGYDLLMGDTHGVAIADINQDGRQDLITARGGGSGSNARNAIVMSFSKDRQVTREKGLSETLPGMRGRTTKLFDADQDGDLDLILTAIPLDFSDPTGANYVFENRDGIWYEAARLPATRRDGHKLHVTDWNNDLDPDLIMYGEDRLFLLEGRGGVAFEDVTRDMIDPGMDVANITSAVSIDFDQDGDLDLVLTRAKLPQSGDVFYDADSETIAFYMARTSFQLDDMTIGEWFQLDNYQAPWPHERVFTGEAALDFVFPGETHSGQSVRVMTSNALGWPDQLETHGLYIGYVGNDRWRVAGKVTAPVSGVIRGVKTYDAPALRPGLTTIVLENTDTSFEAVNIGLEAALGLTGATAGDINNDGYVDIVAIKQSELSRVTVHSVFLNTGDGAFTPMPDHGLGSEDLGALGLGVEVFDFNQDGHLDAVFGNERGRWHLFRNTGAGAGSAIQVKVGRSPIGKASALGAKVTLTACAKTQHRHIGFSSSPYSQSADTEVHFGIGNCQGEAQISVAWPNGERLDKTAASTHRRLTVAGN